MRKLNFKETARDIISLGSPVFFIIVIVRIYLLSNYEYLSQFIFAGILLLGSAYFLKIEFRTGLGLIAVIFTSLYYNNLKFTIFAAILYCLFLYSLYYLKTDKKEILKGFVLGALSTGISYYIVRVIFNP